jgi:5'-nucleotidase
VLAANSIGPDGLPALPPYDIVERAGVRVGFIGVVTPTTPRYLLPSHAREYRYLDISDTVNRWVPVLQRKGVQAIVVLAHAGALQHGSTASGEVIDETRQMSDAVDLVVSGHTHSPLNVRVPNADGRGDKLVVQAWSYGVAYERVRLTIDRKSGDVVRKNARLERTDRLGARPDPRIAALVSRYRRLVAPVADRVVAVARVPLALPIEPQAGALDLGQLLADAERAAGDADFAFTNHLETRAAVPAGKVSYADLFQSLAYEWPLVRMRLRGSDLTRLLAELRADGGGPIETSGLAGRRPLDDRRSYVVVTNGLLAGGNQFPALRPATDRRRIGTDLQALVSWLSRPAAYRATASRVTSPRSRAPGRSRRPR